MTQTRRGHYIITRIKQRFYVSRFDNSGIARRIQEHGKDKYLLSWDKAHEYCEWHAKHGTSHEKKEEEKHD